MKGAVIYCYQCRESQGGLLSKENNKKERREEAKTIDQLSSGASPISNIFILFWPLPFIIIILPVIRPRSYHRSGTKINAASIQETNAATARGSSALSISFLQGISISL